MSKKIVHLGNASTTFRSQNPHGRVQSSENLGSHMCSSEFCLSVPPESGRRCRLAAAVHGGASQLCWRGRPALLPAGVLALGNVNLENRPETFWATLELLLESPLQKNVTFITLLHTQLDDQISLSRHRQRHMYDRVPLGSIGPYTESVTDAPEISTANFFPPPTTTTMADTSVPPPPPSTVSRPVSEALLNDKVR